MARDITGKDEQNDKQIETGVNAVRVEDSLQLNYLDSASRLWSNYIRSLEILHFT